MGYPEAKLAGWHPGYRRRSRSRPAPTRTREQSGPKWIPEGCSRLAAA